MCARLVVSRRLLLLCALFSAGRAAPAQSFGCHSLDHEACDEICKQENFWYGHCRVWDGTNFGCKCLKYQQPLNGDICAKMQGDCAVECARRGEPLGGYCYPHPTSGRPAGDPRCRCFKPSEFATSDDWN